MAKRRSHDELLSRIVADYLRRCAPRRRQGLARYEAMPDLRTAIWFAALALDESGKIESHQRRVGAMTLGEFNRALQRRAGLFEALSGFDELHELLRNNRVHGVGELTVYDTAVRIGAFLGFEPEAVYVHAGAAQGARELGLPINGGKVQVADLPHPLRRLSPDQVEDCLCIYKGRFARGQSIRAADCGTTRPRRGNGG